MFLKKIANKSRRKFAKSMTKLYDKPLRASSEREKELVEKLKTSFRDLSVLITDDLSNSGKEWSCNQKRLIELVLNNDPREFMRWDVIVNTMFVTFARYIHTEFRYLKNHSEWAGRWSKAIAEDSIGHPVPYWRYPQSSENLIHHAYHIAQFEDKLNESISNFDVIVEFGGGYGNMCKLSHNLGFKGQYVLYDFPVFSFLQQFYLDCIGIDVLPAESFSDKPKGVFCVSQLKELQTILTHAEAKKSLFIATWSLSETPLEFRNMIFSSLFSFGAFLIAYQSQFREINNIEVFSNWMSTRNDIEWTESKIKHLPKDNRYLYGKTLLPQDNL